MWLRVTIQTGAWVHRCAENATVSRGTSQTTKQRKPLGWILKTALYKATVTRSESHVARVLRSREQIKQ